MQCSIDLRYTGSNFLRHHCQQKGIQQLVKFLKKIKKQVHTYLKKIKQHKTPAMIKKTHQKAVILVVNESI